MGRKTIDKTGEERLNKFGSKMTIKEYRSAKDIDVLKEFLNKGEM